MNDPQHIPFLLRLFDDASPSVREKVRATLLGFGPQLRIEIERQNLSLTREQELFLIAIEHTENGDGAFRRAWLDWIEERLHGDRSHGAPRFSPRAAEGDFDDATREAETQLLEEGLSLLARWQNGQCFERAGGFHDGEYSLSSSLDALAAQFRRGGEEADGESVAEFLFSRRGLHLRGAGTESYYEPRNSNLLATLQTRRGLPITLACLFILLGHRLGLRVDGCNFPGHFLARVRDGDADFFYDCFDGGRRLKFTEVAALRKAEPSATDAATPAILILARVLRNLVVAFENTGDLEKARFALGMLAELEHAAQRG